MKASKFLIPFLALGLVAAAPLAGAQDEKAPAAEGAKGEKGEKGEKGKGKGGRGMGNPEERVAQIDKAVGGLSDEQKAKIKDIIAKTRDQVQALPQEERREKARDLMRAQTDEIRALLTDEQKAKFAEMANDRGQGGERKKKKDQ